MIFKYKPNKSALKRIKLKKNCIQHKFAYKSHLLANKKSNRLRKLKQNTKINKADILLIKSLI